MEDRRRQEVRQARREEEAEHQRPAFEFIGMLFLVGAATMAAAGSGMFTARGDVPLSTAAVAIAVCGLAFIVLGRPGR